MGVHLILVAHTLIVLHEHTAEITVLKGGFYWNACYSLILAKSERQVRQLFYSVELFLEPQHLPLNTERTCLIGKSF